MTQQFLAAAYSRRPAPKQYDPSFLNVELARIARAMPSYVIRSVTANTTVQVNDGMLVANANAGAFTITLPSPAKGSGQPVTIKKSDASSYAVTIGGTVDGVANRTLDQQNDSIIIQSDGSSWFRPTLTASGASMGDITVNTLTAASVIINTALSSTDNLVTYGKIFSDAVWTKTNLTVTADSVAAPDGTLTADTLTGTGLDALVVQTLGTVTADRHTLSLSVKAGNTATSEYGIYDVTGGAWHLRIRITWTGTAVTGVATVQGAGGEYTYTDQGGGWYLVSGTTTSPLVLGRTYTYAVYPLAVTVDATGKYIYAWNATCTPRELALDLTGPVSLNGAVTMSSTLAVTGVATFTAQPIMSSLTASVAVFTDGSKGLVSKAVTGTGNVVLSASPTLTGTAIVAGITYSTALGSLTNYNTPAAFTQTLSSQFANTASGATLMGYGTTGDVTLKNRAGTDALIVTANTVNVQLKGSATVTGAFGCNAATAQTAYASGGALAGYVTGAFGLDSDAHMQAMFDLVVKLRAALVANGIMS